MDALAIMVQDDQYSMEDTIFEAFKTIPRCRVCHRVKTIERLSPKHPRVLEWETAAKAAGGVENLPKPPQPLSSCAKAVVEVDSKNAVIQVFESIVAAAKSCGVTAPPIAKQFRKKGFYVGHIGRKLRLATLEEAKILPPRKRKRCEGEAKK